MAKASANLFPYLHLVPAAAPASPAAGSQRIFLDSADSNKLKRKDSAGTVTTIEGGGGGGSTIKDRRWVPGASETTIDDFNDDSLDAAWTRIDGTGAASGNCDWTEGADSLSMLRKAANTGNAMNAIVRPIGTAPATGDAWVTCLSMFGPPSTNYVANGIIISDGTTHGAGKQVTAEMISAASPANALSTSASVWTNWGTFGSATANIKTPFGVPAFLRLVYRGSSQWRADVSPDGVLWMASALITLSSFIPSHVGFYSRDGGSGTLWVASHETLRRVSGVS